MANDFSNWEATRKHYGLFANCVVPAFQPSQERLLAAERYAISRSAELEAANGAAIQARTGQNAVGVARSGTSPWVRDEKSAVQIASGGAGRYVAQGIRYS